MIRQLIAFAVSWVVLGAIAVGAEECSSSLGQPPSEVTATSMVEVLANRSTFDGEMIYATGILDFEDQRVCLSKEAMEFGVTKRCFRANWAQLIKTGTAQQSTLARWHGRYVDFAGKATKVENAASPVYLELVWIAVTAEDMDPVTADCSVRLK